SHTGALAGSDEAYNAFFDQARIIRVETIHDLFAKAAALASQPPPGGSRVGILTNAGGIGIMATDACIANGLELARLTDKTRTAMKQHVPPTASVSNPVDIIGDADEKRYAAVLKLLVEDENVDLVLPIWTPTLMAEAVDIAAIIAEVGIATEKPVLACIQTMGDSAAIRRALLKDRIPHYQFPESAARAMSAMARFAAWSRRPQGDTTRFDDTNLERVQEIVALARSRDSVFISEPEGHDILRAYGLPVPEYRLTKTKDEALAAAKTVGYPVVLKIVSPDILHKTDFGGVRVNIADEVALRKDYDELVRVVGERAPDASIWGVLVQRMAGKGTETILGMKRDPQFGPLLMFGLGGVMVEVLKDVVFRVAPISDESAQSMVTGIKAHKLLEGFRGELPRDVEKVKECLLRLSQLVTDFEDFDEIDINPLRVFEEGRGAIVLDARFLLRQPVPRT
ncbi:MAG TPA: CoA-binding protein, partial [candidate division WOR-3 bacterium]|nr:CoA-binding protein [candidate division WOR-3 bacterium]